MLSPKSHSPSTRYTIILRPEPEGGFTVFVPSLPGCITYGKDLDEAKKMAREAIELYLEDMQANGETIPKDAEAYFGSVEIALKPLHSIHA
ncbi:MAG: type II toxin-antitoxin system HicB family antitoxin [bacterium]|nr:type II toxin-antitoxin system HicB family antitoxin [bacterium]MDZ4299757.1 type II toxin-antitoxin system HicB family antitoxin [Candidatus Sungbacteria bacterium]